MVAIPLAASCIAAGERLDARGRRRTEARRLRRGEWIDLGRLRRFAANCPADTRDAALLNAAPRLLATAAMFRARTSTVPKLECCARGGRGTAATPLQSCARRALR